MLGVFLVGENFHYHCKASLESIENTLTRIENQSITIKLWVAFGTKALKGSVSKFGEWAVDRQMLAKPTSRPPDLSTFTAGKEQRWGQHKGWVASRFERHRNHATWKW